MTMVKAKEHNMMHRKPLTRAQREALYAVFCRDNPEILNTSYYGLMPQRRAQYRAFRRTAIASHMGCVIVPWAGMYLGIEPDGYTHS